MGKLDGFGAALRSLRKSTEGGGTLTDLAQKSGIDASELSKYELERQWPSRLVLERILDGLGISFVDLAIETDRQRRLAAGEPLPFPSAQPSEEDFERRVRQIVRDEFHAKIGVVLSGPSGDLQKVATALRSAGYEADLETVAALHSLLKPLKAEGER